MSSPLLNLRLPDPIVIHALPLTGFYACMLGVDCMIARSQTSSLKTPMRIAMAIAHVSVPLVVVSPSSPANVAFAVVPWFIASYSARISTGNLFAQKWIHNSRNDPTYAGNIYKDGLWKAGRGVIKLLAFAYIVQPLLPSEPDYMLRYPWLSRESLSNTLLFGADAYLIFGFVDILAGIAQAITGWTMEDMFDAPYLATSPRDFWSRRWNKHIRNALHAQIFSTEKKSKKTGFFHTTQGRALLSFLASAAFHELVIWSVCRKVTLENFCFFILHGLTCAIEVKYFKSPKSTLGKWAARSGQLCFMALTGRLFLGPFLRHKFMQPLPFTQF